MAVATPMVMMMVVTVIIMIVVVIMMGMVGIGVGIELLRSHSLFGYFGQLEDVVHRLVLVNRRPELGQELRVVAVIVVDLALLAGELAHALEQRAAHLLVCHGDADPMVPREQVLAFWQEMDDAGANWHFHSYSGVKHGFTDPGSDARGLPAIAYDASADRQSWAALMSFLDEVLG